MPFMVYIKLFLIFMHIIFGCIISFLFITNNKNLKNLIIRKWSEILLIILNVKILDKKTLINHFKNNCFLIFSNHISWLDIIIYNSLHPMVFIAKDDVKKWPFIGFLASQTNTIFINRKKPSDVKNITNSIDNDLLNSEHICIFPEGSSTDGARLLRFKSNLFQIAINSNKNILPICIRYFKNNKFTSAPAYYGEITFIDSIINILKLNGIHTEVSIFEEIIPNKERKELANEAYEIIHKKIFLF